MNLKHIILAFSLVALPATAALAQNSTHKQRHSINARKENQQDRIAQGVKSGQLTAGETAKLERQQAGINKEEKGMRAQDNGHLTAQDRHTLASQQNQESRRIERDKENSKTAPGVLPPTK